ncbi:hypothetical protein BSLG_001015 [Batrachochytrium salamandrivorans]|nr:hypothetical protein BASA83_009075 [Batrachochytrium salamandrivorans]KAJ1344455.1 hypothetical protein BSLG_001015 [Batrachochytrium salamandrivorans]
MLFWSFSYDPLPSTVFGSSGISVYGRQAPNSYDKPFWERSSRRKVVALPSLHMATFDYNNWLITYDSRGSVVFQPRKATV